MGGSATGAAAPAEVELGLAVTNVGRETATIPYQMSVEVAGAVATTSGDLPQNEVHRVTAATPTKPWTEPTVTAYRQ